MLYWGRDGHYLKYRCPEKSGLFCCLKQHEAVSRCSTSDYGLMVILSYSSPRSHPQPPLLLPFSLLSKRLRAGHLALDPEIAESAEAVEHDGDDQQGLGQAGMVKTQQENRRSNRQGRTG